MLNIVRPAQTEAEQSDIAETLDCPARIAQNPMLCVIFQDVILR